jgi:hypothetical protein
MGCGPIEFPGASIPMVCHLGGSDRGDKLHPVVFLHLPFGSGKPEDEPLIPVRTMSHDAAPMARPGHRASIRRGRSPGSRFVALSAFPGQSQWLVGRGSPLTVAGAAPEWPCGVPNSLLAPTGSHHRGPRRKEAYLKAPRCQPHLQLRTYIQKPQKTTGRCQD